MAERIANPSKAEKLFKQRRAQIDRAYKARLKPKMSKAARKALEAERTRQLALARAEFARLSHAKAKRRPKVIATKPVAFKVRPIKTVPPRVTRAIPIGGTAHYVEKSSRREPPPRDEMPVSEHWRYRDRETGEPVAPWEIDLGPQYDDEEGETPFELGEVFADENYSYEDIETDWGGYDHQDTGYADEIA